jgi:hypothetical protein
MCLGNHGRNEACVQYAHHTCLFIHKIHFLKFKEVFKLCIFIEHLAEKFIVLFVQHRRSHKLCPPAIPGVLAYHQPSCIVILSFCFRCPLGLPTTPSGSAYHPCCVSYHLSPLLYQPTALGCPPPVSPLLCQLPSITLAVSGYCPRVSTSCITPAVSATIYHPCCISLLP